MEFQHQPIDWFRPYARNLHVNDHAEGRMEASLRGYHTITFTLFWALFIIRL
jgi:hypothetical protein